MARKTDWNELEDGSSCGLGQRMFATDQGDYPILEVRSIEFDPSPEVVETPIDKPLG
jgi:type VI secretion system protein ImpE